MTDNLLCLYICSLVVRPSVTNSTPQVYCFTLKVVNGYMWQWNFRDLLPSTSFISTVREGLPLPYDRPRPGTDLRIQDRPTRPCTQYHPRARDLTSDRNTEPMFRSRLWIHGLDTVFYPLIVHQVSWTRLPSNRLGDLVPRIVGNRTQNQTRSTTSFLWYLVPGICYL